MHILNKDFLKNFSTPKEQNPYFKLQLRQVDSEGHVKYVCSSLNV